MPKHDSVLLTLIACALAACADDTTVITVNPIENWIAAPEYEFGDQMEGDALLRPDPRRAPRRRRIQGLRA